MKRYVLTLVVFVVGAFLGTSQSAVSDVVKANLLRQLSSTEPGDTARMEIYYKLSKATKEIDVELYYINKLMREAELYNNNKYKCQAYLSRMIFAYNQYDAEEVNRWMRLLQPIAEKEKLYDMLFMGRRCVIDMFQTTDEFEREERDAKKLLRDATALNNTVGILSGYICLSNAYRVTFRSKQAAEVLEKAYKIAYEKDDSYIMEINNSLIDVYKVLGDNVNQLKCIKRMDADLQRMLKKDPSSEARLQGWIMMNALAYLNYYVETEQLQLASVYLKMAEQYNMAGYGTFSTHYHTVRFSYFMAANKWEQALIEANKLAEVYNRDVSLMSFLGVNFMKTDLLFKMGREMEALKLYESCFILSDSLQIAQLNKQTEQLKKDYVTDRLLLEKEKISRNIQTLFLILVIVVIVIVIFFIFHTYRTRKGLKAAEEGMRKMADEMELANIAKERFLSTISTSISGPLNAVVEGSLQLATDEVTEEQERKEISKRLNKTSAELMELINNILNLSKLEAGMMKFRTEDVEILPFVQGILTMRASNGQKIKSILPDSDLSPRIHIDIAKLQEIFNYLLFDWGEKEMTLEMTVKDGVLNFRIVNTMLAAHKEQSQEIAIANEVTRLLIEYFKGSYKIDIDTCSVHFTLPTI